ncbi:unnamed protein product [Peronospora belbahrii]|uniref:Methyltransferase-like protein 4 n=1 Tax=Peronospora belbahrii TaxID=622444 RepID=A0ABN8DAM7_9STRA|nr:unnamed protein product [Peronospora belbahrii]
MEPKVSCVNHAALVNDYYMKHLCLREDSLQIASTAFIRPYSAKRSMETSIAAARRQQKRHVAAQRRAQRLEQLITQGKFVPLRDQVRGALQDTFDRYGGPHFKLHVFLPSFRGTDSAETASTLEDMLNLLSKASKEKVLDDGSIHFNATNYLQVAVVNNTKIILPAGSSFAQRDVRELRQISLEKFKLIVMDPPWQNKSVLRGKQYGMFDHTDLLAIDIPHIADVDECVLAVWVTNRPRYMTYLRDQVLPFWGFTFHACWYWLKLSKNGELVTPLDLTHRLPVETLVVAYRAKDHKHEQLLRQRLGEQMRVVFSIPLRHSWKPPPECFISNDIISTSDKKVELFARELRPYWTSVGNEQVFKFQNAYMFQPML